MKKQNHKHLPLYTQFHYLVKKVCKKKKPKLDIRFLLDTGYDTKSKIVSNDSAYIIL